MHHNSQSSRLFLFHSFGSIARKFWRTETQKVCCHWRIQGHLGPRHPQRSKVACLAPPKRSIVLIFFFTTLDYFFYRYEAATCHWRFQIGYFLRFQISKFSSESPNLPEIGCLCIQDRFKTNVHALRKRLSFLHKNINFCHIFDALGRLPGRWQVGHFFYSKVNLCPSSKKIVA